MNRKPIPAAITSDKIAAHSMVTMLLEIVAITIDAGTNMITSRSNANIVDLMLFPIDCRIMAADFM